MGAGFNLANVLYEMGHEEQATERFRQATEMDPEFVEAWNNLGNVCLAPATMAAEVKPTHHRQRAGRDDGEEVWSPRQP